MLNLEEIDFNVINNNPKMLRECFEAELRDLGFSFESSDQTLTFMPEHKKTILPIAIKYYLKAKALGRDDEQEHFLRFFHFKGFDEVVPMLLQDFCTCNATDMIGWTIAEHLYQIRSKSYIPEYLEIISNAAYGSNRQMLILLMGEWKIEAAIPILIELLEDEDVRLHAISALGYFKREEFRPYFEQFENSKHPGWRKYARAALKKLNK